MSPSFLARHWISSRPLLTPPQQAGAPAMLAARRRRLAADEATRERVRCEMAVLMDTGVRVNPMLAAMAG